MLLNGIPIKTQTIVRNQHRSFEKLLMHTKICLTLKKEKIMTHTVLMDQKLTIIAIVTSIKPTTSSLISSRIMALIKKTIFSKDFSTEEAIETVLSEAALDFPHRCLTMMTFSKEYSVPLPQPFLAEEAD